MKHLVRLTDKTVFIRLIIWCIFYHLLIKLYKTTNEANI